MSDYSDSDSDYNENEKILLEKYRKRKYDSEDETEEGVFNVGPEEDDSDDEDILAESDIEGQEEDDLPNDKAWGRNKKAYYSSDYVNPNTYDEKELQFAEFEAQEAEKLEAEINQHLDFFSPVVDDKEADEEEDLNEKETKLVKEGQELLSNLISDFKEYMQIYKGLLKPFMEKYKNGEIDNCSLIEFVDCFSSLILNYSTNIFMYLLLKKSETTTINHPILKRLEEYRQHIQRLLPVFEKTVKIKIEIILKEKKEVNGTKSVEPKKKKLKLLQNLIVKKPKEKQKKPGVELEQKVHFAEENEIHEISKDENDEDNEDISQSDVLEKRPITYQMAKNKGLTPHRKKEQKNPRVKHRNKYKKAKVRRKGAVREVRNEGRRYDGEISGIKTNVTKGIKIKV